MTWLNGYRKKLVVVGCVAAIVVSGGRAYADFTFGTPTNLGPPVNTSGGEDKPCISADGLELFFSSGSSRGGSGGWDLWVATRMSTEDEWGPPVNLGPTINSSTNDWGTSISADGLSLYFDSKRGPFVKYNIRVSTRASKNDPWQEPVNLGPTVNFSEYHDNFPCISADDLSLYFTSCRPGGLGGPGDIWVTRRATKDDVWGEPVNLGPVVNSTCGEMGPVISANELTLFFSSGSFVNIAGPPRPGGFGQSDLWVTRRASKDAPWEEPVNLGSSVNTGAHEMLPFISPDGSTLYFASDRPGGPGDWDIWQVEILPVVDFNGDGIVDAADMRFMVDHWGTNEPLCDIGPAPFGDGIVDVHDLIVLAEHLFTYPGAVAYWKLDEIEGDIAYDNTGTNFAYVIGGTAWQPIGGQVDGALQLDGVDGCAIAGPVLNTADGPFSVFAWVNGGAPGQVVVSQQGAANWLTTDGEGNLMTELKGTGRSTGPLQSQTIITDGHWHRVGFVWDGANRILYVDDVAAAEDTQDGLEGSDSGLYIGTGSAMQPGTYWSGLIDDVRIYNQVVTP